MKIYRTMQNFLTPTSNDMYKFFFNHFSYKISINVLDKISGKGTNFHISYRIIYYLTIENYCIFSLLSDIK